MPRIPRGQMPGLAYHVLNRGNGRATIFHKDADYRAFCELLYAAKKKFPVGLLGFCTMPNHFHLVLQPQTPAALSAMKSVSPRRSLNEGTGTVLVASLLRGGASPLLLRAMNHRQTGICVE